MAIVVKPILSEPHDQHGAVSESSPLLSPSHDDHITNSDDNETKLHQPHPKFLRVVILCVLSIFLIEVGDYMQRAPFMRILEDILCRQYYSSSPTLPTFPYLDGKLQIPESSCKVPLIQSELAMLRGWDQMFSCIPGILVAVPYGVVADRWGRKLVLVMGVVGILLALIWTLGVAYWSESVDIRWFWAGNLFLFVGGGSSVIKAMFYAMIADVAVEERRAQVFFQLMAAALISTVIGVPAAWYLMKKSLWIPMCLGLGFILLSLIICLFLPETLDRSEVPDPALDSESDADVASIEDRPTSSHRQPSTKKKIAHMFKKVKESHFIFTKPILFALSITFLLQSLYGHSIDIIFQLASERFHWSVGDASFLIPIGSITTFLILIIILPTIYHLLSTHYLLPTIKIDLRIARSSLLFYILGSLTLAFGFLPPIFILGTIIFACGSGFPSATRSLATSLVHPDEVSRLYAVLAVIETVGTLMYGPLLSKAFGWGMRLGGWWEGMVFLVCGGLFAVVGLPVWVVGVGVEMDVHG